MNLGQEAEPSGGLGLGCGALAAVSAVLGVCTTQLEWGSPDGFHGTGLPFAGVYWDKPPGKDHFLDYPNPLAYVLNPIAFFFLGLALWGCVRLVRRVVAWRRRQS
ncbi:MAG: hypothetical protein HYZ53_16255 [Planctomycetes bacterium]|nr:hypothetical protein [Planctomycetota bacterium]